MAKVENIMFSRDPHSQEFRGFVFATMKSSEDAYRALSELRGKRLLQNSIQVEMVSSLALVPLLHPVGQAQ
jgi:RNA recognition motif-containing protein